MTLLATTELGGRGIFSGSIYRLSDDFIAGETKRVFTPPATETLVGKRPSGGNYGNRHYMVGGHSANLLVDEEFRGLRQGMAPPNVAPSLAVGAGAILQIGYTRFYDEITGERSPLSSGTPVTGSITRTWTNLPTQVPDEEVIVEGTATFAAGVVTGVNANYGHLRPGDRIAVAGALTRWAQIRSITDDNTMLVDDTGMAGAGVTLVAKPFGRASHVETWVAVTGALPRLSIRVPIGTTSVVESTPTLALGQAETISFEAMPYGTINLIYNDRQLIAGVEEHRDTLYLSAIGFPERHEGLRFITKYNEPIIGMFRYRDYVVVLCPDCCYKYQGYTADDAALTVLEPSIGGIGHHTNKVTETYALVPSRKGIQLFNGAFHPGMPTRRREWLRDYRRLTQPWEQGFAVVNPNDETYQLYPDMMVEQIDNRKAPIYVGHYGYVSAQAGGSLSTPEWTSDQPYTEEIQETLSDTALCTFAAYITPSGTKIGYLLRGDTEGRITRELDDSSLLLLHVDPKIVTGHLLMNDPGGDADEGKKLIRGWSYVCSEETAWEMRVWPGDEFAYAPNPYYEVFFNLNPISNVKVAPYLDPVPASRFEDISGDPLQQKVWSPEMVRVHKIDLQGRGWTLEYRFIKPSPRTFFAGFGGVWAPGKISRATRFVGDVE